MRKTDLKKKFLELQEILNELTLLGSSSEILSLNLTFLNGQMLECGGFNVFLLKTEIEISLNFLLKIIEACDLEIALFETEQFQYQASLEETLEDKKNYLKNKSFLEKGILNFLWNILMFFYETFKTTLFLNLVVPSSLFSTCLFSITFKKKVVEFSKKIQALKRYQNQVYALFQKLKYFQSFLTGVMYIYSLKLGKNELLPFTY